ncbi:MAG: aldehyde dehydrogenase family protein [Saprospiraceae bacterium]|nr:aldehyde dehydrogenase family protein [Lewinella sp.]
MDPATISSTDREKIQQLFQQQQSNRTEMARTTTRERIARLDRIAEFLNDEANNQALNEALWADFKKPEAEVALSEVAIVLSHIRYIKRKLKGWMRPRKVPTNLALFGTSSHIYYEPKGNTLIIGPWNYPFMLSVYPLLYAIAAGNTAIIKPSELTVHTSAFIAKMMRQLFPEQEVVVVEGGVETTTQLLDLPFHHIYFTGSPRVGRIVMGAAAKHLASVTLELGGKSPAVIDDSVNMETIAEKTLWGKSLNGGQTCIAPDYMIIQENVKEQFVEAYRKAIRKFYGTTPEEMVTSKDFAHIINDKNFDRLHELFTDAVDKSARVEIGGVFSKEELFFSPTVLSQVTDKMEIMKEEIFGPILPILTYRDQEEIPAIINRHPQPLSMYVASKRRSLIHYLKQETSAGGMVINDYLLGFGNPNLPFGGVNNSGIGKSMGFRGFTEFSNEKGVISRYWDTLHFLYPPYTETVNKMLKILKKWA